MLFVMHPDASTFRELNATRSITCQPAFSIVTVICSVLSSTTQITRLGISIRTGLESRMLRAGHGGRHLLTSRFQSRLLTNCIHRQVSFTRSQLTSNSRTIMASATANAERFFADRASPLCSMDIGKSFGQLRSVWCIYKSMYFVLNICSVPRRRNTLIS